ncbi:uncharacterized protein LOC131333115 isoform X1 [Rhododendron vialii]|uniref:uncharacterized protein LOC131333115 isoform X1 n=1 Tax=Rhododendron vialii TaxID=182163 RepID=UPI00265F2DAD|nr:uncharacterized protein LOC131333115 isoform X1 [Rhododendron vialii]XP_058223444.1 uncharacterized protein LOC131333115 isoform X1 [Rhododendron vialii]XP_058223445.1 uncharacterized protein LOC131333115 isoform X1 [Rhododendron vialii]
MSIFNFKGIVDSLTSVFSGSSYETQQNPSSSNSTTMDGVAAGLSVSNERAAYKLKGYLDLATEEIAKAVRAEEWGLVDDAVAHYQNAQRILTEAYSTPVPSYISFSEREKVKSYRQKISKWQSQTSERLQTLRRRSGVTSTSKVWTCSTTCESMYNGFLSPIYLLTAGTLVFSNSVCPGIFVNTLSHAQTIADPSTKSYGSKDTFQKSTGSPRYGSVVKNQTEKVVSSKPVQGSGSGYDAKLVEMINSVIVDRSPSVKWEDIAGLEKAKQALMEMVILPTKRRDLFTGLRRPARGLLLFGPPGTGKTMLAKAVASESEATFFNVSASSLTSKWVGEGEKLVRELFMVAVSKQPSVIFMDEANSIMSTRVANEHDASRRLKSEFLVQFDGVTSNSDDLVIVIGATNKPQELDDAVLRRLVKRIYIPLPDAHVRRSLLKHKLKGQAFSLPAGDLERLVEGTEGYSGSDLQALCEEAAMMPIRELGSNILTIKANQVRPLRYEDFQKAMTVIRPSLQKSKWEELERWNQEFGAN